MLDSNTPHGPARWRRAAENYDRAPESWAGKRFASRITAANELVQANEFVHGPFRFERNDANNWGVDKEHWKFEWRPLYYTCSLFCAAMQGQLTFSSEEDLSLYDIILAGEPSWHSRVTKTNPVKEAKCKVCGRTISNDGQLGGDPQVDFPDWAWAYDPSFTSVTPAYGHVADWAGAVTSPEAQDELAEDSVVFVDRLGNVIDDINDIRAVRLTERETQLFWSANAEVRRSFAEAHGDTLDEFYS